MSALPQGPTAVRPIEVPCSVQATEGGGGFLSPSSATPPSAAIVVSDAGTPQSAPTQPRPTVRSDLDCQSCGACCAHFRVSFYWAEALDLGLPPESYRPIGPWYACLTGTEGPQPRCHALDGTVGVAVHCTRYAQRPSPCRELQPGDPGCLKARARHGLGLTVPIVAPHPDGPHREPPVLPDAALAAGVAGVAGAA